MSHDEDFNAILDPHTYFLVLFDFTDMNSPHTVRASIWEVDPLVPGFAYCMIDYYYNIKAKSSSGAPFNLWPYSLKFDIMRPRLIYRSLITSDDKIETEIFPGRDAPLWHPLQSLEAYARSGNLKGNRLDQLAKELGFPAPGTKKRKDWLLELQKFVTASRLESPDLADALAKSLYLDSIKTTFDTLPSGLRARMKAANLI